MLECTHQKSSTVSNVLTFFTMSNHESLLALLFPGLSYHRVHRCSMGCGWMGPADVPSASDIAATASAASSVLILFAFKGRRMRQYLTCVAPNALAPMEGSPDERTTPFFSLRQRRGVALREADCTRKIHEVGDSRDAYKCGQRSQATARFIVKPFFELMYGFDKGFVVVPIIIKRFFPVPCESRAAILRGRNSMIMIAKTRGRLPVPDTPHQALRPWRTGTCAPAPVRERLQPHHHGWLCGRYRWFSSLLARP